MSALDCSIFTSRVEEKRALSLYRYQQGVEQQDARTIVVDGKSFLNFSSNDYLGLNHHPEINKALAEGANKFGTCASASSLITGNHYAHRALEDTICDWLNFSHCLLFGSGFSANYGVLESLGQPDVAFCLDKLSHASLIDGALASKATVKRFKHNDVGHLEHQLKNLDAKFKLVVSEGIFSMDGDAANVIALSHLAKAHRAGLYMDDAHAIGVLGEQGQGSVSQSDNIDVLMGTFGKAIATSGAFVASNSEIHEYLVNYCRHYIYSTAISPAIAWATKKSIAIVQKENWRREKIRELSRVFTSLLDNKIKLISSNSSIHAIVVNDEALALEVAHKLKEEYGIWLTAIRPPTVPPNTSRLRVTITSAHEVSDINKLANGLHEVLNRCQI